MFDNRQGLSKNFKLNGGKGELLLTEEIGRGANCIVYRAVQVDGIGISHKVLVKECYPAYLLLHRDEEKKLIAGVSDAEKFIKAKRRFKNSYEKNSMIRDTLGLTNSTVNVSEFIEQNNTFYAVMNFDEGSDYKNYHDSNLKELLEHVKSLAVTIGKYHQNNFLHLDIKPENMLVIPETTEHILLFDFDSITTLEEIKNNPNLILSYSDGFSAPEQIQGRADKIGFHTDIYSIGAILFYKLFNRKVTNDDGKISARYDFTQMNFFDKRYPPKLFRELDLFFHKTIATSTFARRKEMDWVVKILDELIELADVERVFPVDNFQYNSANFVGRAEVLNKIHDILQVNQLVFLSGIGGIGKTEIAKKYAALNRNNFDTIIFCKYESSIVDLVTNQISINGIEQEPNETAENFFRRKISILRETLTPNDLIILDNLDSDGDDELENLLACPCKFVVTTRLDFSDYNFKQIEIRQIEDPEELFALFKIYNGNDYDDDELDAIKKIFRLIESHTMTVELTAKYLRETGESPQILLERFLEVEGITNVDDTKVKQRKDKRLRSIAVTDHLRILFNLSNFDETEIEIMRSLSLLGGVRISQKYFCEMLRLENSDALEVLIKRGWIESDDEKISLHQIILDLTYSDLKPSAENCPRITDGMIGELKKERVNWTSEQVKKQLAKIFLQRVTGKNLKYAELCVCYGKEKYLSDVEKICLASHEIFAYDVLQRFYRLKVKFSAQVKFLENVELEDECRKSLQAVEKYFDLAKKYCSAYSTDSNYLAENFSALAFETDDAINSEMYYITDKKFSAELNRLYEKIIQVLDEAEENLFAADKISVEEKISLLERIRDFYSANDYTAMYRSENFSDPYKRQFYQQKINALRRGDDEIYSPHEDRDDAVVSYASRMFDQISLLMEKTVELMEKSGSELSEEDKKVLLEKPPSIYDGEDLTDVSYYDLAQDCEFKGDLDTAIEFYRKAYEAGEPTYDSILYEAAQTCLRAGYVQKAKENLEEILRIDRENPEFPFTCHASLDLIDIFIDEKNFDAAKKLIDELIEKSSDADSEYLITYLVAAYFRLYLIENDLKFWKRAVKYFRFLYNEKKLSDRLHDFVLAYVLRLTDSEKDLAKIENLTRRLERYDEKSRESTKKIFEHAIELSKNNAEYHIKFLTAYSLYLSDELISSEPAVALKYCELAQKYLDENSLDDAYLQSLIYRAKVRVMVQLDDFEYSQTQEVRRKCDYFLLTAREVKNLSDEEKFKRWRDAAREYQQISNYRDELRCLEEAEKFPAEDFQEYWWLEVEKLNCLVNLGEFARAKTFATKLYDELIEKYFSEENVSLTDKLNDLAAVFEKISCAAEVFALNLYEICMVDERAEKNLMASLEIKKSAEPKLLKILDSLTEINLTAKQIDFIVDKMEKISQLNFATDFSTKCLRLLNKFSQKFQYDKVEFKNFG